MKFVLSPFKGFSRYLYFGGIPLLLFSWLDHYLALNLLDEKLRLQFFVFSIILIACAAIINLVVFLIGMLWPEAVRQKNPDTEHD